VSEKSPRSQHVAAPAATGAAGSQFEAKVGAFYLLSLLSGAEARGLPGAIIRTIGFQQRGSGFPLDDVLINAVNADGSAATLEIQAKRTLTFTSSDDEFRDVVARMWEALQKPAFEASRHELAVAIARTTTRVEHACQEVLHWARQFPDGATFAAHIGRKKFSSEGMRDFVDVFCANLVSAGVQCPALGSTNFTFTCPAANGGICTAPGGKPDDTVMVTVKVWKPTLMPFFSKFFPSGGLPLQISTTWKNEPFSTN